MSGGWGCCFPSRAICSHRPTDAHVRLTHGTPFGGSALDFPLPCGSCASSSGHRASPPSEDSLKRHVSSNGLSCQAARAFISTRRPESARLISAHAAMRPPSPSIPEKDFFFTALDQNLRRDGREFLEARAHSLSFGVELGHVECLLGKTRYARL